MTRIKFNLSEKNQDIGLLMAKLAMNNSLLLLDSGELNMSIKDVIA